jgi:hypothetical protein
MTLKTMTNFLSSLVRDLIPIPLIRKPNTSLYSNKMTLTTMTSFPPYLVRDLILIPLVYKPNPSLYSNNIIERS